VSNPPGSSDSRLRWSADDPPATTDDDVCMSQRPPHRVVVAGGGIAGAEALLALRELAGDLVSLTLVEPRTELVLRALAPGEAFGTGATGRLKIGDIAAAAGAEVLPTALDHVDVAGRSVRTRDGKTVDYEALIVAVGARPAAAFPSALTWWPEGDHRDFAELLADADAGRVRRIAFVVPSRYVWQLPAYELALLTARRLEQRGRAAHLRLITPETAPLSIFGAAGSAAVARELENAGVGFLGGVVPSVRRLEDGLIVAMRPTSDTFAADRVVTLPHAFGPEVSGLRCDIEGFLVTDPHCAVRGTPAVWAAGEVTSFRPMHGGLAARQADCAAHEIARCAGARVPRGWYVPLLSAQLRTGRGGLWLQRDISDPLDAGVASREPLWSPPGKIAARRLGALLAGFDAPRGLRLSPTA
jgi:hypothetical protein